MTPFTLNIGGTLRRFDKPAVMGIVNVTPDSFFAPSRVKGKDQIVAYAAKLITEGADIIDIGGCSTRPGSAEISEQEEVDRVAEAVRAIVDLRAAVPWCSPTSGEQNYSDTPPLISVDTYRAAVAREAVRLGADIINDISGGNIDPEMFDTIADLRVPYVLTHSRGTLAEMHEFTDYNDPTRDVLSELGDRLQQLALLGVSDIIVDPGFGFSKTLEQNYQILDNLSLFSLMHRPVLVGFSRKSMATRLLNIPAADALNATSVLNTLALDRGAAILRVHDVAAARQCIDIYCATKQLTLCSHSE